MGSVVTWPGRERSVSSNASCHRTKYGRSSLGKAAVSKHTRTCTKLVRVATSCTGNGSDFGRTATGPGVR